jgi:class 3 adenylate cyclase
MAESRKTVTIVFADVTGSTALGEQTDPEAMRRIMERYFEEMRAVLARPSPEGTASCRQRSQARA